MTEDEARDRLLTAAEALFYQRGVQAVGMDEIRAASGVSLKRLYQCYPSKHDLVAAYLRRRDVRWRASLATFVAARPAADRPLAVFDWLRDWFAEPDFRGCAFSNTLGELGYSAPGPAAAVRAHKQAVRTYLATLLPVEAPEPPATAETSVSAGLPVSAEAVGAAEAAGLVTGVRAAEGAATAGTAGTAETAAATSTTSTTGTAPEQRDHLSTAGPTNTGTTSNTATPNTPTTTTATTATPPDDMTTASDDITAGTTNLAEQLNLLLEGAITVAAATGDPAAADHAKAVAVALLAAKTTRSGA